jgi:hypothetical protein
MSDLFEKIVNPEESEQSENQEVKLENSEKSIIETMGMDASALGEMTADILSGANDKLMSLHARFAGRNKLKTYEMQPEDVARNAKIFTAYFKKIDASTLAKFVIGYQIIIPFVETWENYLAETKKQPEILKTPETPGKPEVKVNQKNPAKMETPGKTPKPEKKASKVNLSKPSEIVDLRDLKKNFKLQNLKK